MSLELIIHELQGAHGPQLRVLIHHAGEHVERHGHVDLGRVSVRGSDRPVDGRHLRQRLLALAEAVELAVQNQRVDNQHRRTLQALLERPQVVAAQLLVHQRDVVGCVEGDDRVSAQPVLDDGTGQLVQDLLDGAAVAARLLGRDAVDGRGLLGDLDARVGQPRGHLVGGADAAAVGGAVDAQHQRGGDEAILERAHARRLGVKTHPRVVDPAHDCS